MKKILLYAALVAASWTAIYAGVDDLPLTEHDGQLVHYYEVQPKETIYSLSNKLGLTQEQIIACNPDIAEGLKAFSTLYFPVAESEWEPQVISHEVEKKETVYGLSKRYGVTVDELISENPSLRDGLKAGQIITVTRPAVVGAEWAYLRKKSASSQPDVATSDLPAIERDEEYADMAEAVIDNAVHTEEAEKPEAAAMQEIARYSVALLLPFKTEEEKADKQALRMTEFLKGFLVAADTLRHEGRGIDILVYDTHASLDTVNAILASPEMSGVGMIIAPDDETQLEAIGRWGKANGTMVLNSFMVRDTTYLTNPVMIQTNVPHAMMYDKAIDALVEASPEHQIVVLKREGGSDDHMEFIDELHTRLSQTGRKALLLTFTDKLTSALLRELPSDSKYVFIPVSGKQSELMRVMPALKEMKENALSPDDVLLFGYPEWVTFKGDALQGMQALNTTVYSRFYNDPDDLDTKNVEASFSKWYGRPMDSGVPRYGLLGFDTGMMIIRAMRHTAGVWSRQIPDHVGVQNSFDLQRDGEGLVNNVLYFINFRPSGLTERTRL